MTLVATSIFVSCWTNFPRTKLFFFIISLRFLLFFSVLSLDIDECNFESNSCEHNCHNTEGNYFCTCRQGYTLSSDGKKCIGSSLTTTAEGFREAFCFDCLFHCLFSLEARGYKFLWYHFHVKILHSTALRVCMNSKPWAFTANLRCWACKLSYNSQRY